MIINVMIHDTIPQMAKISVYTDYEINVYGRISLAYEYERWLVDEMNIGVSHIDCVGMGVKFKILAEQLTDELLIAFKLKFA